MSNTQDSCHRLSLMLNTVTELMQDANNDIIALEIGHTFGALLGEMENVHELI
jgi:hypothetical protein